ncbi:hypothetical protein LCGC14_0660390 [marine sediment metagenome]|uniref:Uncharacterized protein n=1 Tax=marine sediment metagenome TaxID=412755 RepID=A0A0F9TF76_9ZZZZ
MQAAASCDRNRDPGGEQGGAGVVMVRSGCGGGGFPRMRVCVV